MIDIYVTNLDGSPNGSYVFNYTLYHEIGHVDQVRNIGYDAYINNSVQFKEQYADEYAYCQVNSQASDRVEITLSGHFL